MKKWLISVLSAMTLSFVSTSGASNDNPVLESIYLNDTTMRDTARLITAAAGVPIVVSAQASTVKVDIFLRKVGAQEAVEAICRANGMWHRTDRNTGIIQIQSLNELRQEMQIRRDEYVETVDILYPSAADVADAISQLFADRVYWIRPGNDNFGYDRIRNAFDRMDLLANRGTFDTSHEDKDNRSRSRDGRTSLDTRGSTSRTQQQGVPLDQISTIADILQKMPEGRLRLLYEQFGLSGKGDSVQQVAGTPGIVFISVMQDSNAMLLRSYDQEAIDQIARTVKSLDRPAPQVLLEVKLLSVSLGDREEHALDFLFSAGDVSGGFADGVFSAGGGQAILKPDSNFAFQGTGLNPSAANLTAATEHFSLRAQMLQTDGRLTRLATPNLLVADNEASRLFVGSEVTVMEKAQKTVTYTTSGNLQNPNISWDIEAPRRRIGVSLVITPKIHADRSVTIRLLQEHSTLGGLRYNIYSGHTASGDSENNFSGSNESSSEYFISQDISMQSLATTTVARDRQVVVIGGMIEERTEKKVSKIPGLGNIPWLGELLFSRTEQERIREELLVVIRPYVLLAPGEAESPSLKLMRELSQHPSATPSLPPLGVSLPSEQAKPGRSASDDPWIRRLWQEVEGWHVDTKSDPRIQQAIFEYIREEQQKQAEEKVRQIKDSASDAKHLDQQ